MLKVIEFFCLTLAEKTQTSFITRYSIEESIRKNPLYLHLPLIQAQILHVNILCLERDFIFLQSEICPIKSQILNIYSENQDPKDFDSYLREHFTPEEVAFFQERCSQEVLRNDSFRKFAQGRLEALNKLSQLIPDSMGNTEWQIYHALWIQEGGEPSELLLRDLLVSIMQRSPSDVTDTVEHDIMDFYGESLTSFAQIYFSIDNIVRNIKSPHLHSIIKNASSPRMEAADRKRIGLSSSPRSKKWKTIKESPIKLLKSVPGGIYSEQLHSSIMIDSGITQEHLEKFLLDHFYRCEEALAAGQHLGRKKFIFTEKYFYNPMWHDDLESDQLHLNPVLASELYTDLGIELVFKQSWEIQDLHRLFLAFAEHKNFPIGSIQLVLHEFYKDPNILREALKNFAIFYHSLKNKQEKFYDMAHQFIGIALGDVYNNILRPKTSYGSSGLRRESHFLFLLGHASAFDFKSDLVRLDISNKQILRPSEISLYPPGPRIMEMVSITNCASYDESFLIMMLEQGMLEEIAEKEEQNLIHVMIAEDYLKLFEKFIDRMELKGKKICKNFGHEMLKALIFKQHWSILSILWNSSVIEWSLSVRWRAVQVYCDSEVHALPQWVLLNKPSTFQDYVKMDRESKQISVQIFLNRHWTMLSQEEQKIGLQSWIQECPTDFERLYNFFLAPEGLEERLPLQKRFFGVLEELDLHRHYPWIYFLSLVAESGPDHPLYQQMQRQDCSLGAGISGMSIPVSREMVVNKFLQKYEDLWYATDSVEDCRILFDQWLTTDCLWLDERLIRRASAFGRPGLMMFILYAYSLDRVRPFQSDETQDISAVFQDISEKFSSNDRQRFLIMLSEFFEPLRPNQSDAHQHFLSIKDSRAGAGILELALDSGNPKTILWVYSLGFVWEDYLEMIMPRCTVELMRTFHQNGLPCAERSVSGQTFIHKSLHPNCRENWEEWVRLSLEIDPESWSAVNRERKTILHDLAEKQYLTELLICASFNEIGLELWLARDADGQTVFSILKEQEHDLSSNLLLDRLKLTFTEEAKEASGFSQMLPALRADANYVDSDIDLMSHADADENESDDELEGLHLLDMAEGDHSRRNSSRSPGGCGLLILSGDEEGFRTEPVMPNLAHSEIVRFSRSIQAKKEASIISPTIDKSVYSL